MLRPTSASLVDTYDTLRIVYQLLFRLRVDSDKINFLGITLTLERTYIKVRQQLDEAGFTDAEFGHQMCDNAS